LNWALEIVNKHSKRDAPDKGFMGAKDWADQLRTGSPAERGKASEALVFRANRDLEKKVYVLNRLTQLLVDVSADEDVMFDVLRTLELVVENGLEACPKLIREKLVGALESFSCAITRQKDVRQRARELLDKLRPSPSDKG
jgi:hypothetical protein